MIYNILLLCFQMFYGKTVQSCSLTHPSQPVALLFQQNIHGCVSVLLVTLGEINDVVVLCLGKYKHNKLTVSAREFSMQQALTQPFSLNPEKCLIT